MYLIRQLVVTAPEAVALNLVKMSFAVDMARKS